MFTQLLAKIQYDITLLYNMYLIWSSSIMQCLIQYINKIPVFCHINLAYSWINKMLNNLITQFPIWEIIQVSFVHSFHIVLTFTTTVKNSIQSQETRVLWNWYSCRQYDLAQSLLIYKSKIEISDIYYKRQLKRTGEVISYKHIVQIHWNILISFNGQHCK